MSHAQTSAYGSKAQAAVTGLARNGDDHSVYPTLNATPHITLHTHKTAVGTRPLSITPMHFGDVGGAVILLILSYYSSTTLVNRP